MIESEQGASGKKPKRPRLGARTAGGEKIHDPMEFTTCLGSKNARPVTTVTERMNLEIWYDKHYIIDRNLHEDESGNKRDVPPQAVEALVTKSLKHLLFYGSALKNFVFLNHQDNQVITRMVIKDATGAKPLSIVVQTHFKSFNRYELTVITAFDGDLRLAFGQQFIEFVDENCSQLKKFDNGTTTVIFTCQD